MIDGVLYCNDGDWVESLTALVEHHDGRLEIIDRSALREAHGTARGAGRLQAVAGARPRVAALWPVHSRISCTPGNSAAMRAICIEPWPPNITAAVGRPGSRPECTPLQAAAVGPRGGSP
jgi:hypothetical protein